MIRLKDVKDMNLPAYGWTLTNGRADTFFNKNLDQEYLSYLFRARMHDSWGDVGPNSLRKDIMAAWRMHRTCL